ncbi:hypothetical protein D020_2247B, partial [Vibrio parahaemolyticus SBR10290]
SKHRSPPPCLRHARNRLARVLQILQERRGRPKSSQCDDLGFLPS